MNSMNAQAIQELHVIAIQASVIALIQSHPDPTLLKDLYLQSVSIAFGHWSQDAVSRGLPGLGKEEMQTVAQLWIGTYDKAIAANS
jgi:hypothetical protein